MDRGLDKGPHHMTEILLILTDPDQFVASWRDGGSHRLPTFPSG
jgi:hypothetical protein